MPAARKRALLVAAALAGAAALSLPPSTFGAQPFTVNGPWSSHATVTSTPGPGMFAIADNGRGHATRIGVFTLASTERDNFATGTISDGAFTLTTPSGDTIFGTYDGTFALSGPTSLAFTSPGVIVGGTGRFNGSSGPIVFTGTANVVTFELSGRIAASLSLPK